MEEEGVRYEIGVRDEMVDVVGEEGGGGDEGGEEEEEGVHFRGCCGSGGTCWGEGANAKT